MTSIRPDELYKIDLVPFRPFGGQTSKALLAHTSDYGDVWVPRGVIRKRTSQSMLVSLWWATKTLRGQEIAA